MPGLGCNNCLKPIWRNGRRTHSGVKLFKHELFLIGFCGGCYSKGAHETHSASHLVKPVPEDIIILEEVMGS